MTDVSCFARPFRRWLGKLEKVLEGAGGKYFAGGKVGTALLSKDLT